LRHQRHLRHGLQQVAVSKRFAAVTQNAKSFAACVTSDAFASSARPIVSVAPGFSFFPIGNGAVLFFVVGSESRTDREARCSGSRPILSESGCVIIGIVISSLGLTDFEVLSPKRSRPVPNKKAG
jgi:hypothetical protein